MHKQIMIVDDDANVLKLFEIILQRQGYTVVTVNDPGRAMELLAACTPDLFIVDVMMPHIDGLELCQHLRRRTETAYTPIILVSGMYDERMIKRAVDAGANDYVPKLISPKALANKVKQTLNDASRQHS